MTIKLSKKNMFTVMTAVFLYISPLLYFINVLSKRFLPFNGSGIFRILFYLFCALTIVLCFRQLLRRGPLPVLVPIIILMLTCLSCLNPNTYSTVSSQGLFRDMIQAVVLMILVYSIQDIEGFLIWMERIARVVLILGLLVFLFADISASYMAYGYRMLLASIVLLYTGLKDRKKINLILALAGAAAILVKGSRGSFTVLILSVILYVWLLGDAKKKILFTVLLILAGIAAYFAAPYLAAGLYVFLQRFGIQSRTLKKIVLGTLTSNSSRTENFRYSFSLMGKSIPHLLFGYGTAGERFYFLRDLTYMETYGYPHNIFLELFLHYGVIGGSVTVVYLIWSVVKSLGRRLTGTMRMISVILLAYNIQLLISSSYLQSEYFFAFLGWAALCAAWSREEGIYQ